MAGQLERATDQGREQVFNPRDHLIQIKSGQRTGDYLPVAWRLVWFRERFPNGSIETELVHLDVDREMEEEVTVWEDRRPKKVMKKTKGFAVFKATVKDGHGGIATGTGSEAAVGFGDYIEKAETKAVGRALAALGFGTQFTGEEYSEGSRIVDSPVARANAANGTSNSSQAEPQSENDVATDQQVTSIRKLCLHLRKPEPENVTSISYLSARKLIAQLTTEYKSRQGNGQNNRGNNGE